MYRFHPRQHVPGWVPVRALLVGELCALALLCGLLLYHLSSQRRVLGELTAQGARPQDPRLAALDRDVARSAWLLGGVAAIGIAGGVALLVTWRSYSHASLRLVRLHEYANDILDSLSIGLLTVDMKGTVTAMNDRALRMLGISAPSEGRPYADALAPYPALRARVEELIGRGQEFSPFDMPVGDGRMLRIEGGFLATEGDPRAGAVLQVADVTRLRDMEEETRRSERLAALGTLAAGVAHEIRNPLSAIDINLQLLEETVTGKAQKERAARYFEVVKSEIHRLNGIIEGFIRFARPRPLERRRVRIEEVVDALLVLVRAECESKGIGVARSIDGAASAVVEVDPEQVQQALLNLVLNGLQSMSPGGTLTLGAEVLPDAVQVRVTDTGTGIPAESRERVFDLFYSTKESGSGLGLPIAQRIVTEHGGSIRFETGPSGTTFFVALPRPAGG